MRQYISVPRFRTLARIRTALTLVVAMAGVAGCQDTGTTPPVASVTVTPARSRVAVGSPVELTFRFDVATDSAIDGDYEVFVHVLGNDGRVLWNDDHEPSIPTSRWKGGQTVEYTRTMFVPDTAHPEEATLEVGLYRENDRLPLRGPDGSSREAAARAYRVATLQLAPASENVFLILKSGWYPDEYSSTDPTISWRWTQKTAVLAFTNPHTDSTLLLDYSARPDLFGSSPQQVTVYANDQTVTSFPADSSDTVLKRIPIPASALGAGDTAEVRIEVDRTFRPSTQAAGGKDDRDLGLRVYHTVLERR
jgi:hypothetical protein